jgi:localization factor PodJL
MLPRRPAFAQAAGYAMTSGVSWNELEAQRGAGDAAPRAGLSFGRERPGSGSISARLEELSQRIGGLGGSVAAGPITSSVRGARLSETVARLNARLAQMTTGGAEPQGQGVFDRAFGAAPRDHAPQALPEPSELGIDQVIAEIAARQRMLDEAPAHAPSAPAAQPHYAEAPAPDFSSLEQQLHNITRQIETLRHPCGIEDALAGLRTDLADIGRAINEAMPRRALEALQHEVHALADRIGEGYGRGGDPAVLETIERGLARVHSTLNEMTPAEGLAGFNTRISELADKIDNVAAAGPDPETLRYLEAAINELRELSAGVASAEGVAAVAGDVQALGARIDHIAQTTGTAGLDSLAQRVNQLTQALDTRVTEIGPLPNNLESLVKTLTDKLDRADSGSRDQIAFDQLERQIVSLAEKIDAADQRSGNLGAIERGIQQLTLQVRAAREDAATTAERVARTVAADLASTLPHASVDVSALKQDLETLHANQSESEQRTHDTLEAVHDTLERLVERLTMVETDVRSDERSVDMRANERPAPSPAAPFAAMPALIPEPAAAMPAPMPPVARPTPPMHVQRGERTPIAPDLPADTPLEPGSTGRGRSAAERIAASEAALGPLKREGGEVTGKANFIAAARRAAQAAASEGGMTEGQRTEEHKDDETPTSLIGRFLANRRRALVLGVSALLVIYGAMQVVSMMGGSGGDAPRPASSQVQPPQPTKLATPAMTPAPAITAEPAALPSPAAPGAQTSTEPLVAPTPTTGLIPPMAVTARALPATPPAPASESTGAIKPPLDITALSTPAAPAPARTTNLADKLPASMGGPALRTAGAAGNPAAEYEIGVRFAEGRGVPANMELAVQWLERAANQGLAPAQYRLGSLYEKGQGVKKDLEKARTLYLAAADKGNAKAVHNLAVLYAEGIDGKPDYRTAAQWFRKAAERGVADSQYNLGILYARGIGVDQNLAESYKWFSLAAAQGDQDSAKKRDDVAGRLDQQSLVAARLAVQTWAAEPAPDEAMNVKAPANGWDGAPAAAPAKPAAARRKPQSS